MGNLNISSLVIILFIAFSCSWVALADENEDFLECLKEEFEHKTSTSSVVYTKNNSSYASILQFSITNLRFALESTPKPIVIITPEHEVQIPPVIHCAKESGLQIRTRSGGHDYEGLSHVAQVPFVLLDMINLSEVIVDADEKTAWIGAGSTLGSIYYGIAKKSSTLAFPAGVCPTVGAGGHISGGGYGVLLRKYGLAADNVIDARIVDVNGKILDRKTMGEDLFWAIRGGGGASFGVILAWKLQLVDVPEKMTVFAIDRTLEQNATELVHRWQSIPRKFDRDFYMSIHIRADPSQDGNKVSIRFSFYSFFQGNVDRLLALVQEKFPELGLVREDCREMSWIESVMYYANLIGYPVESLEGLLNRTQPSVSNLKMKSDYVQKPIPKYGLDGIWRLFYELETSSAQLVLIPYGGKMDDISESAIPFPHRAPNLYKIGYMAFLGEEEPNDSDRHIRWIRRLEHYLTPFVSKSPREAYVNYRDLDLGVNNIAGETTYAQASVWGLKYFKNNFNRLVQVKTAVDPKNFFQNEQSIPSLHSRWTEIHN